MKIKDLEDTRSKSKHKQTVRVQSACDDDKKSLGQKKQSVSRDKPGHNYYEMSKHLKKKY
jgi:hypothetical protein